MPTTLGFVLFGSNQLAAADYALCRIRKIYPNNYCMIMSDYGADYSELARRYNSEYFYARKKLGYPVEPYGWNKESSLEFLERFYLACLRCNSSHIMYVEEDVAVLKKIYVHQEDEIIGFRTCHHDGSKFSNGFPDSFINSIQDFSGVRPEIIGYGAQGGTVVKVSTYVENYHRIKKYLEENFDNIQKNIYAKIGWIDCLLTWYYLLCGKKYTYNVRFYEHNIENVPPNTELVTAYKRHYLKDNDFEKNQAELIFNLLSSLKVDNSIAYGRGAVDIHEHLPVIRRYAENCDHVTEMGTRAGISIHALLIARPSRVIAIDLNRKFFTPHENQIVEFSRLCGTGFEFWETDNLKVDIEETDLLFIDTLHTYNQLTKELRKHQSKVRRWIILHDTATFGRVDEPFYRDAEISDLTINEPVTKTGLFTAVEDFLLEFKEWSIKEHLVNCNGLTILERSDYK